MTHLLNCPVCGYTEIAGNACPNCDTDIPLLRSLAELPVAESLASATSLTVDTANIPNSSPIFWRAGWQIGIALLILILGIALGASGSFFFLQPAQLLTTTASPPTSSTTQSETKTPTVITQTPIAPKQLTLYTVKLGDNLTVITEKSCGQGKPWQLMIEANPQLKSRPNYINVGEVLNLPNCEG